MHPSCALSFRVFALSLFASKLLLADTVDTRDGSRFVGKVLTIDAGVVNLDTVAAGKISIMQTEVTAISTDQPISIRLETGTRFDGTVSTQNGAVQIVGPDGHITTTIPKVVQSWPVGGLDPAAGFSAKRISPQDELDLYANYNRQVAAGVVSADQFKAGIDYTSYITAASSWFVRDEAGFDRIMAIEFYETAAAGLGEALIKNDVDLLTARVGIAYRYDSYESPPVTPTVSTAAADFELKNDFKNASWELEDALVVLPALSNFKNVVISQDSFFQIPLKNPAWKLRLGFSNDYVSEPPAGVKRLDTTYYTRLILDWGQ